VGVRRRRYGVSRRPSSPTLGERPGIPSPAVGLPRCGVGRRGEHLAPVRLHADDGPTIWLVARTRLEHGARRTQGSAGERFDRHGVRRSAHRDVLPPSHGSGGWRGGQRSHRANQGSRAVLPADRAGGTTWFRPAGLRSARLIPAKVSRISFGSPADRALFVLPGSYDGVHEFDGATGGGGLRNRCGQFRSGRSVRRWDCAGRRTRCDRVAPRDRGSPPACRRVRYGAGRRDRGSPTAHR
jgi:hypothetical protein